MPQVPVSLLRPYLHRVLWDFFSSPSSSTDELAPAVVGAEACLHAGKQFLERVIRARKKGSSLLEVQVSAAETGLENRPGVIEVSGG